MKWTGSSTLLPGSDRLREMAQLGMTTLVVFVGGWAKWAPEWAREITERRTIYRTFGDYDMRRSERFAKPVEIAEMWGRVPTELATDGFIHRVITVANGTVLLRNRPNPFWHGRIPFLAYCPMPDPHYFHGPGKIEICEKMQFAANHLAAGPSGNVSRNALQNPVL
jgi:hypothetical protein